ncbi:thiamine pyrophosphate-dependent enzyme [Pectinatus haikarae]|uniref:Pyruvate oxidase n=1 Tax=Pectinatus haikarae TaxID=349096 RepID=A0ABT9Y4Y9_9FIRM|nr:thiamine pyrophosphate-binding protein [Pectinatus haikarae]MDQ0202621.1 pyruvate oxidase [Pectinatus haikarae]
MAKMTAGQALARVLISWEIDHIYGITADSINNTVDGFYQERKNLKYIQVRHEEIGSLAAAADAKLTGRIGVCFGSAGPGAVHLLNGLYDARQDRVPVLAIVGQSATGVMNTNFFQEMNQDPIFADVAQFHKQVVSAEQIPNVVDEAIRSAYASNSISVVIIPDDLSGKIIDFVPSKTRKVSGTGQPLQARPEDVRLVIDSLDKAERPILWIGQGARDAAEEVTAVSEKFSMPVLSTAPATGIMPADHPNYMGCRGRLGTKPAFETSEMADLIIFVGTNYPFARFLPKNIKSIQINNDIADFGKQYDADITVPADAKSFLSALLKEGKQRTESVFLKASQVNKQNWDKWLDKLADDDSEGLSAEGVIKGIKSIADDDAVFALDVGNNTEWAIRQLPLNGKQKMTMSSWYGTMGYGLPAGLAGKLSFPERQVWSISGDGGYAMVMPDLLTEVKYNIPVINVVLENKSLGFIQHEKIVAGQALYGIDLLGAEWAAMAENMGAIGFRAANLQELQDALKKIEELQAKGNKLPILLDAKIKNVDPIDTHTVPVDPVLYDKKTIDEYREQYKLDEKTQPALSVIFNNVD